MKSELKLAVYNKILDYPDKSDYTIAQEMNLTRSMVYRTRISLVGAINYELARNVAGKFLTDFQMASDYFKKQISRLETSKSFEAKISEYTPSQLGTVPFMGSVSSDESFDASLNDIDDESLLMEVSSQ